MGLLAVVGKAVRIPAQRRNGSLVIVVPLLAVIELSQAVNIQGLVEPFGGKPAAREKPFRSGRYIPVAQAVGIVVLYEPPAPGPQGLDSDVPRIIIEFGAVSPAVKHQSRSDKKIFSARGEVDVPARGRHGYVAYIKVKNVFVLHL